LGCKESKTRFCGKVNPSKTEKEMADRVGAGNVEAPVTNDSEKKKKSKTTTLKELTEPYQVLLGTSACKEGVVVVVGESTP
jgi:hypothetical protein